MDYDVVEVVLKTPFALFAVLGSILLALIFFSVQLFRFGPSIKRLNKIEVLSQLYHLAETQKEMTSAFGEAVASSNATRQTTEQLRVDLEGLREFITEMQEKLSEYNADRITSARLADEDELPPGTYYKRPIPVGSTAQTPEQLFQSMKTEWQRFQDAFRSRLAEAGIPAQLNRMGKMTYMLTDRRRKIPLPVETADLITALHSQYKRYVSLRSISAQDHDDFVRLVKTAIAELQLAPKQGELSLGRNGNGLGEQPVPNRLM